MDDIICKNNGWFINIKIDHNQINFKIDTGAAVTAIPARLFKGKPTLPVTTKLKGAGGHVLDVTGCIKTTLTVGKKTISDTVYIIEGLVQPLLGKPAIEKLGILNIMIEAVDCNSGWIEKFPKLFVDWGSCLLNVEFKLEKVVHHMR